MHSHELYLFLPFFLHYSSLLTDYRGLKVDKHCSRHMVPCPRLAEEGAEGVVVVTCQLIGGHGPVRLDAVLEAVQFPAGVADLHASLAHMNTDTLTLGRVERDKEKEIRVRHQYEDCREAGMLLEHLHFHIIIFSFPDGGWKLVRVLDILLKLPYQGRKIHFCSLITSLLTVYH